MVSPLTVSLGQYLISIILMAEPAVVIMSSPVLGRLVDRGQHRTAYYWAGLAILAVAITILAFARSVTAFIAARLVQGLATAMLYVVGRAIVVDAVSVEHLGHYSGYTGAAETLGFTLGPVAGGPLYRAAGYGAVSGLAFGVLAIDLLLRMALIEKKKAVHYYQGEGMVTSAAGLLADTEDYRYGALGTDASPISEGTHVGPAVPIGLKYQALQLVRKPNFLLALWVPVVLGVIYSAFETVLPKFVQDTFHWTSLGAGLILLPCAIPSLCEPIFGWLVDKLGVRVMAVTGFALLTPSLFFLSFAHEDSTRDKVLLWALLGCTGFCMAMAGPAGFIEAATILARMEEEEPGVFEPNGGTGLSISLQTSAFFIGLLAGPAWGGFVTAGAGWPTTCWSLALLSCITCLGMFRLSARTS
ncbi:major facilitator superfamily domain-containing protein [Xylariaceae sp. FL0662B]|nr:major facilitator superfamily domain-containing protein [Xylariaceae sp. FL0662B]